MPNQRPYTFILTTPLNRCHFRRFIEAFQQYFNVKTTHAPLDYVRHCHVTFCHKGGYITAIHLSPYYRQFFGADKRFHTFYTAFLRDDLQLNRNGANPCENQVNMNQTL